MDCLICHARPADAVGSHIISHFLLEDMSNGPVKGRDKEINFQITSAGSTVYIGRRVLPETIEDTLGRGLDDTDEKQNPYVRDNIFCTVCEKRLSAFESLYKQKVHPILSTGRPLSPQLHQVAYVFWLSMIYRCAITRFGDFVLTPGIVALLAQTVNDVLADTPAETEQNCQAQPIAFNLFLGYLPAVADNSNNVVLLQQFPKSPYWLAVNHYVVLFDYTLGQVADLGNDMGVTLPISAPGLTTALFSEQERLTLLRLFQTVAADRFWNEQQRAFHHAYFQHHRRSPSEAQFSAYAAELTGGDELYTVKYAPARVQRLMRKHILSPTGPWLKV
jgi:hypothetical protein